MPSTCFKNSRQPWDSASSTMGLPMWSNQQKRTTIASLSSDKDQRDQKINVIRYSTGLELTLANINHIIEEKQKQCHQEFFENMLLLKELRFQSKAIHGDSKRTLATITVNIETGEKSANWQRTMGDDGSIVPKQRNLIDVAGKLMSCSNINVWCQRMEQPFGGFLLEES